jgi:hypothetical protein
MIVRILAQVAIRVNGTKLGVVPFVRETAFAYESYVRWRTSTCTAGD